MPAALNVSPAGRLIEIRHQCGRGWLEETRDAYRTAGLSAEVSEFIEDMAAAYGWADAVVCRAGALTVSEVAAVGLAALFVPYPHAVDDHQTRNAEFLVERGAALLLSETGLDAEQLAASLDDLLSDRGRLIDMATRARAAAVPDAAARVAEICREFMAP